MTERLFFALWPGERQRDTLLSIQRDLPDRRGRLAHPQDLHLTLVFLGEVEPGARTCAEEVAGMVRSGPFTLTLDRIGYFPRARILFCGASSHARALGELLNALDSGLIRCGFRPERRRFAPHVTLSRKARPLSVRALADPVYWPVSEFALVLARPGERPRYRVVRTWPLVS